jgi:predicted permease
MVWDTGGVTAERDGRGANILLEPRAGTIGQPMEAIIVFSPLFVAFGLILVIGCANVANLMLARGASRQHQIGVRLAIGASRKRLVRQLLTESVLLALAAAVVGFVVSRVTLEATIHAVLTTLSPELAETVSLNVPASDWRVGLFLLVGAMASTVLFGLAPALQSTRLDVVRAVRGELIRDARPGRVRDILIGIQVTAAALLLICSGVFLRSALASATLDPGIRTSDTILVEVGDEQFRDAMVRTLRADPAVREVSAMLPDALSPPRGAIASAASAATRPQVGYRTVSPEYFDVVGLTIVRGRGFTPVERQVEAGVAVVSESLARELWGTQDAVGQSLRLDVDPNARTRRDDDLSLGRSFTVVGVTREIAGFRMAPYDEARVHLPASVEQPKSMLVARILGDPDQVRTGLLQALTAIDPNMGQVITMRAIARMETYFLSVAFWVTLILGALALVLTLSGLFSVLSYVAQQRTREIGVRMAIGATARDVGLLVLRQCVKPVAIGLVSGTGLAAALAVLLLASPAGPLLGDIVLVLDPVAYAASLLFVIGACVPAALVPALRAARIDPTTTLRQD